MIKTIAYQQGLESVAQQLKTIGYHTIPYDGASEPVDALLYHETQNSFLFQSIHQTNFTNSQINPYSGMLLINVKDRTLQEIQDILKKKAYSPIFP